MCDKVESHTHLQCGSLRSSHQRLRAFRHCVQSRSFRPKSSNRTSLARRDYVLIEQKEGKRCKKISHVSNKKHSRINEVSQVYSHTRSTDDDSDSNGSGTSVKTDVQIGKVGDSQSTSSEFVASDTQPSS